MGNRCFYLTKTMIVNSFMEWKKVLVVLLEITQEIKMLVEQLLYCVRWQHFINFKIRRFVMEWKKFIINMVIILKMHVAKH